MKNSFPSHSQSIRKTVVLSRSLFELATSLASKVGFKFNEYVRYLIQKDIESKQNSKEVHTLSQKEKLELERILSDIKSKKFVSVKEIENIVGRLIKY